MPNYLEIPDDLLPLIEKRSMSDRRVAKRRISQKSPATSKTSGRTTDRRKTKERRKKARRLTRPPENALILRTKTHLYRLEER